MLARVMTILVVLLALLPQALFGASGDLAVFCFGEDGHAAIELEHAACPDETATRNDSPRLVGTGDGCSDASLGGADTPQPGGRDSLLPAAPPAILLPYSLPRAPLAHHSDRVDTSPPPPQLAALRTIHLIV